MINDTDLTSISNKQINFRN